MAFAFLRSQFRALPPVPAELDLSDKVIIITGATSGIGREAANHFARFKPRRLILTCRDAGRGSSVLSELENAHRDLKDDRISIWELDLNSFASVKAFAERVQKELDRLDAVVMNAGIHVGFGPGEMKKTGDRIETSIQTNVLSPILLTFLLHPLLDSTLKGKDLSTHDDSLPIPFRPRVVFVGGDYQAWADPKELDENGVLAGLSDENRYHNPTRYFVSKVCLSRARLKNALTQAVAAQLLLQSLVPHLSDSLKSVLVTLVSPGICATNLSNEMPIFQRIFLNLVARSSEAGARNVSWATLTLASPSQQYSADCEFVSMPPGFLDTEKGMSITSVFWTECLDLFEKIAPGSTSCLV